MAAVIIEKPHGNWTVTPNLIDYDRTCVEFAWKAIERQLDGLPGKPGSQYRA